MAPASIATGWANLKSEPMTKVKTKRGPAQTFNEWADENWDAFMRASVRVGLLESFRADDGRMRYRTTGKDVSDEAFHEAFEQAKRDGGAVH